MIIYLHGVTERFYRGVSAHKGRNGKPLNFFGYTWQQVEAKESQWLADHMPVSEPAGAREQEQSEAA